MIRLGIFAWLSLFAANNYLPAQIVSSYDLSAEGWTATSGIITWVGTGGNPNGHVRFEDTTPANLVGTAPAVYLGNRGVMNGGTMSADFFGFIPNGSPGPYNPMFGQVTITNSGSSLSATAALVTSNPSFAWTSYSYPLTAAAWGMSATDWATLLSNVTSIEINMDRYAASNLEITGMDNFRLTPIPEPGSLVLAVLPAWLLCYLRRKKAISRTPSKS